MILLEKNVGKKGGGGNLLFVYVRIMHLCILYKGYINVYFH